MARKRRFEQLQAAASAPKEKVIYTNPLQQKVGEKLEDVEKQLQGKGRTILYGIGAVLVLAILVFVILSLTRRSSAAAQTALGKAIETSQLRVTDTPPLAGSTEKTFKTEAERANAAIAEFQAVADKFGGDVGDKAKYFIAVNKLSVDRPAGISELEGLSQRTDEVGKLSKYALAQTRVADGKLDEGVTMYQQLIAMDEPLVAKDTLNFELAKIYEKQGKVKEATDIYFEIAKKAAEAKDMDGKPARMTTTATEAKDKVKQLDPDRAKEIPEPSPESPFGGS